jgi:hypothetical protein
VKGPAFRDALALVGAPARRVALPVSIGIVTFLLTAGPSVLASRNIRWMSQGDPATYFLSWHFFRNTPWGWPLGINPRYGAELAGGIAHADNVPLLTLSAKVVEKWLPDVCQPFGSWLFASFVLQAWFAWLLVGLLTDCRFSRACGTALFVLAPPFLWRLQGHYAMQGQWLLLAALYLCLGPRRLPRGAVWPLLAFVASLVHSYITAMVLGLWLTDWLRRVYTDRRKPADAVELALVPGVVLLGFWQAGLFEISEGLAKKGFGKYRMNLLSLVDPSGWSYVLPDIPEGRGDYEGFNYLGAGGILLALVALPALRHAWPALHARRQYWPLFVVLLSFTCFAVSTSIGFGSLTLRIPVPACFVEQANLLRASGRMFWPVFYALLWVLVRHVARHYSPRAAGVLLATAVLLQAVDTSAGWLPIRRELSIAGEAWPSQLKSPFWARVPQKYGVIRLVPPKNQAPNYATFAYFCAMHGLATDAVYLARIDRVELARAKREAESVIKDGKYAPHTLYVLNDALESEARATLRPGIDFLGRIDGFLVLAPGWTEKEAPRF